MLQEVRGHGSHEMENTPTLVSTCETTYEKKRELNTAHWGFPGHSDDIRYPQIPEGKPQGRST